MVSCIARRISFIMREELDSSLDGKQCELPWPIILCVVGELMPETETWFMSWHSKLQEENVSPLNEFSEFILEAAIVEELFRMTLNPKLVPKPLSVNSLLGGINEALQWVLKVLQRLAQSKGISTVRRTDVETVLERAPIFESLWAHAQPFIEGHAVSDHSKCFINDDARIIDGDNTLDKDKDESLPIFNSSNSTLNSMDCDLLIEGTAPLLSKSNEPMKLVDLITGELETPTPIISSSSLKRNTLRRTIFCVDQHLPWVKIDPEYNVTFMKSIGVETEPLEGDPFNKIYQEFISLKTLLAQLSMKPL